jgi:hypothetical protein
MADFRGMSKSQCPAGCNAERCVISELPYCSHPLMGGVQKALKTPAVLARYADACKAIGARNVHEVPND